MQGLNAVEAGMRRASNNSNKFDQSKYYAVMVLLFSIGGTGLCVCMWWLSAITTMAAIRLVFHIQDFGMVSWLLWLLPVFVTCVQIGALEFMKENRYLLYFWLGVTAISITATMAGIIPWLLTQPGMASMGIFILLIALVLGIGLDFTPEPLVRLVFWSFAVTAGKVLFDR